MQSHRFVKHAYRLLIACTLVASQAASAYDWGPVDAHVTMIEPSLVGTQSGNGAPYPAIYFQVDQAVGNCSAGTWLIWAPYWFGSAPWSDVESIRQQSNTKAILSTLEISISFGTKVRLYGFNMQAGACQASNVMSLNF